MFFSRAIKKKSNFWGDILIIKKLAFEIKISQYTYDCQASCFIDVNLQWKELRKIGKFLVGSWEPYISTNPLYKNDIGVQPY